MINHAVQGVKGGYEGLSNVGCGRVLGFVVVVFRGSVGLSTARILPGWLLRKGRHQVELAKACYFGSAVAIKHLFGVDDSELRK